MSRKKKAIRIFAGIGGFDIALESEGYEVVATCEINEFCNSIIKKNFPYAQRYTDIKTTDFTPYRGYIDLVCGGFPCQPFSIAGKRQGEADDRYLWHECLRAITEIQPRIVFLENVSGITTLLEQDVFAQMETQENGLHGEDYHYDQKEQQRIIKRIISDLQEAGYIFPCLADGTPIVLCVPACAAGAYHRRDRIWFVAYAASQRTRHKSGGFGGQEWQSPTDRSQSLSPQNGQVKTDGIDTTNCPNSYPNSQWEQQQEGRKPESGRRISDHNQENDSDPQSTGFKSTLERQGERELWGSDTWGFGQYEHWYQAATALCGMADGIPEGLDIARLRDDIQSRYPTATEKNIKRAIDSTIIYLRNERLKALGNAVVPQVVKTILRSISLLPDGY